MHCHEYTAVLVGTWAADLMVMTGWFCQLSYVCHLSVLACVTIVFKKEEASVTQRKRNENVIVSSLFSRCFFQMRTKSCKSATAQCALWAKMATVRDASVKCQNKDFAILSRRQRTQKAQQSQRMQRTQRSQRLQRKQEYNIQSLKYSMDICAMTHLLSHTPWQCARRNNFHLGN